MKTLCYILSLCCFLYKPGYTQKDTSRSNDMYFISDTQKPMLIEKILHAPNQNRKATNSIFTNIIKQRPVNVYILGDVVALGYAKRKWKDVDAFLDSCRLHKISVEAILGNHEVMIRKRKGARNFQQRFATNVPTGYVSVHDSIAIVLLNSNFKKLSAVDRQKQQNWYAAAMAGLDKADSIKAVIVCCHHAPYTNSNVVKGSAPVQQYFVPAYIASKKARLFITGHSHNFEHFRVQGKDFLVIGGGGGLHQPMGRYQRGYDEVDTAYKPMYHYLSVKRNGMALKVTSHFLRPDFSGFDNGTVFDADVPVNNSSTKK